MPGGDRGAIQIRILWPALEAEPTFPDMLRHAAARKATEQGGRLTDDPPTRTFIPAHDTEFGPMPDVAYYVFAMVRV